eukprot:scaffold379767_cov59-Attheya_sp.AAC.2
MEYTVRDWHRGSRRRDEDNPATAKRKLYPFTHMFSRENCSFAAFQDFFSIQYFFTVPPMRVHIRMHAHLRSTLPMADHIKVMQPLRSTLGVVIGRDPGYVPDPPTRFPTGFLHTSSPRDMEEYFLSCCGAKIAQTNLLRFSCMAKKAQLPSMVIETNGKGKKPEKLLQIFLGTSTGYRTS